MGSGRWQWIVAGAGILATACTVDGSSGDFGGVPTASASGPSQTNSSDDDDDESEGEEDTEASASDDTTGGSGGTTGMAMTSGSTGMGMTAGSTSMGMGSSGDDSGLEQPASGMYSECTVPEDCVAPSNVCITINMGVGFCTNMGCANPAADCDPTPGGTAVPICFPIELNMMPDSSCALDCSGGQICPTGMACAVLEGGSICG